MRYLNQTQQSSQPLKREAVVSELGRLLPNLRVISGQDILEQGEKIDVAVTTWKAEEPDAFDVTVVVYGRGGQPVELAGIPIALTGQADRGELVMRVAEIRARGEDRGHVGFLNLATGEYRLRIPNRTERTLQVPENVEAIQILSHRVLAEVAPDEVSATAFLIAPLIHTIASGNPITVNASDSPGGLGGMDVTAMVVVPVVATVVGNLLTEAELAKIEDLKGKTSGGRIRNITDSDIRPIVDRTGSVSGKDKIPQLVEALKNALEDYLEP